VWHRNRVPVLRGPDVIDSPNPPTPPAPSGYGVIVEEVWDDQLEGAVSEERPIFASWTLQNPASKLICKVTSSVSGRNFNLGTFNAGDSLVFKIITDSGTFYSASSMNAGNAKHMF